MKYKKILVTGGAGFVGSNFCIKLKNHYSSLDVIALDNLIRKGSELNLPRLEKHGVKFIKGDIRNKKDLRPLKFDLVIECSADPSVLAGINSSPSYVLETNLFGAINCFEIARKNMADVVFLSTSRVYPIQKLNDLKFEETSTRFLLKNQEAAGVGKEGISELFSLDGHRSLYGTTKLSAELILQEYIESYGIKGIIDRCGVIAGPWQMGKVDQGIAGFWMASHVFKKPLKYIGFGGKGKQVRDILDIDDLFNLINIQISNVNKYSGKIYNVGGGKNNSLSLLELTDYCQKIAKAKIPIGTQKEDRINDVRIYISDNKKIEKDSGWKPKKSTENILEDIYKWIIENKKVLSSIFNN